MNFGFIPPQQRKKYLLGVLVSVLMIAGVTVGYGYFHKETASFPQPSSVPPKEITIDFSVFDDPIFEELGSPVTEIPTPDAEERANPFIAN